jgi:hypothetical protein
MLMYTVTMRCVTGNAICSNDYDGPVLFSVTYFRVQTSHTWAFQLVCQVVQYLNCKTRL